MSNLNDYEVNIIKRIEEKGGTLTPQEWLSPSSIIEYLKCPRCYFFKYVVRLKSPPSINLVKGTIVHSVLEDFFEKYTPNLKETILRLKEHHWVANKSNLEDLELPPEELTLHKLDIDNIIEEYYISIMRKIKMLLDAEKVENEAHAYYMIKPRFRELYVQCEELKTRGYIDRIDIDYDDILTIGDYKTSKKYGIGLPKFNKIQLIIYALLYKLEKKRIPDFASIIFLRYGEELLIEITPSLIKQARELCVDVYNKTRSTDINDYPVGITTQTKWCAFADLHDGTEEWEELYRIEKMKYIANKHDGSD